MGRCISLTLDDAGGKVDRYVEQLGRLFGIIAASWPLGPCSTGSDNHTHQKPENNSVAPE